MRTSFQAVLLPLETVRKFNVRSSYKRSFKVLYPGGFLYENTKEGFWEKSGLYYNDVTSRKMSTS